jgi:putative membrane protein
MWASAIVAYLHYLSLAIIFAALIMELVTLKGELTLKAAWRIVIADSAYGIAGVLVLATGILRVLYFAKDTAYYMHQPFFWVKMGLFATVGLLSLYPTVSFLLWIKALRSEQPPEVSADKIKLLRRIIYSELVGFSLIPLTASMMARGLGTGWQMPWG